MTIERRSPAERPVRMHWIVLANAARAYVFERDSGNGTMREIAALAHPASRAKEMALGRDRPGRMHKGEGSTALEASVTPHQRERMHFAHELSHLLESAALEHRMVALVLMVSNPFLGELKDALGPVAAAMLKAGIPIDLTASRGAEREQHVSKVLIEHGVVAGPAAPE
jgi:protein required for attachment to host cells